mgnify:CR=1 FL=1
MTANVLTGLAPRDPQRARFDQEALAQLEALYSFALKLTKARDDAEDLVSDTMLRAFQRWEQYRLGTNIRAWLFTILYHVFVSRKRRVDAAPAHARTRAVSPPSDVARNPTPQLAFDLNGGTP